MDLKWLLFSNGRSKETDLFQTFEISDEERNLNIWEETTRQTEQRQVEKFSQCNEYLLVCFRGTLYIDD